MIGRMQFMRVRDVGVMPGLLMIAGFIVLGRLAMMVGGALVVFRDGLVVLATLVASSCSCCCPLVRVH